MLQLLRSLERGTRRPSIFWLTSFWEGLGLIFRTFSHVWAIFSNFRGNLSHVSFFHRFFSIFHRFWEVLRRIWEGFWDDFCKISRIFAKIAILQKHRKNLGFYCVL